MTTQRRKARYGWRPSPPDHRDYLYMAPRATLQALPPSTNLARVPWLKPTYDQGQMGTCVPNEAIWLVRYDLGMENREDIALSRLLPYYEARRIEGDTGSDNGAFVRDIIKVLASTGTCQENLWPYEQVLVTQEPNAGAYADAPRHTIAQYMRVFQVEDQIKASLAEGYPVIMGMAVFPAMESREAAATGIVPLPGPNDAPAGLHCVRIMGHDDPTRKYLMGNTWGADWGLAPDPAEPQARGYFTLDYDYVHSTGLCDDFWSIRAVAADTNNVIVPAPVDSTVIVGIQ